ncbi:aminodeoxychorismate synthase component I [Radiobacillus kanasensis]|uniref:aminodeoxychorismate synthase component I n=1 Tax=Radiobacillus kanasensis TaxID=2844358 RepID=UPI001E511B38|nr:aminodeoxychorismate synthase component I [Radiobacillus kanasensis]UFU00708.1 aminodeoxychorismate synthase component I [Radiobacillus kanasensis]
MNPHLLFEFADKTGKVTPLHFHNPLRIYQTNHISEVKEVMENIEKELEAGYYAAGYVSYEAAPAFLPKCKVHQEPDLPLLWFAIFEKPSEEYSESLGSFSVSEWKLNSTTADYQKGISEIKHAIKIGDTYQVNYTARLVSDFHGDDFSFYKQLVQKQQASYSAYINTGRHRILSVSPELFFRIDGSNITTKPMKGTAKRGRYLEEDLSQISYLQNSEKEMAENIMIVDLLRNDIGRLAKPGSVKVKKLFEVESYPTVHQMTSTIEAELEPSTTVFDWFQALFPCGSITGAPKLRTMDYISELETSPRDVYCGAIGFITPEQEAVFNVPIRTVMIDTETNKATYGVGGGVTWDSTVDGEYEELFAKARVLTEKPTPDFCLLESILLDNGTYPLWSYHKKRLENSASYFNYVVDWFNIEKNLKELAQENQSGCYKIRLITKQSGKYRLESEKCSILKGPITSSLAKSPVHRNDRFLFHKTTNRTVYELHQKQAPSYSFSPLLWNEEGELTEFTIGNLVVEQNGKFYTPPVECGLLAGTYRQQLLDEGKIKEKILRKEDIPQFDRIWFINSVRGWIEVQIQ